MAMQQGRLVTCPSRILTISASMKMTGETRGRLAHSVISATTASVIREMVSFDTLEPYTSAR